MLNITDIKVHDFHTGDIVQHFKREMIDGDKNTKYLYMIIGVAYHTETNEKLIIYRELYGENKIYARPYDMFMSEVDHDKYPNIKQQYRFELYEG